MADTTKEFEQSFIEQLEKFNIANYNFEYGGKHKRLIINKDDKKQVFTYPKTSSDHRARLNSVSDLKKILIALCGEITEEDTEKSKIIKKRHNKNYLSAPISEVCEEKTMWIIKQLQNGKWVTVTKQFERRITAQAILDTFVNQDQFSIFPFYVKDNNHAPQETTKQIERN